MRKLIPVSTKILDFIKHRKPLEYFSNDSVFESILGDVLKVTYIVAMSLKRGGQSFRSGDILAA